MKNKNTEFNNHSFSFKVKTDGLYAYDINNVREKMMIRCLKDIQKKIPATRHINFENIFVNYVEECGNPDEFFIEIKDYKKPDKNTKVCHMERCESIELNCMKKYENICVVRDSFYQRFTYCIVGTKTEEILKGYCKRCTPTTYPEKLYISMRWHCQGCYPPDGYYLFEILKNMSP